MLALLRDLLPCFPAAVLKTCCETLLRVMTLSHVVSSPVSLHAVPVPAPPSQLWKALGCSIGNLQDLKSEHHRQSWLAVEKRGA